LRLRSKAAIHDHQEGLVLGFEAESGADGVTDRRERYPGAYQHAVSAHQAAAVGEGKEGAPEFFNRSACLAKAVAGGQVEHPDADYGEDDEAGDPHVTGDVVLLVVGDEEAAKHRHEKDEDRAEQLWRDCLGVGVVKRHGADDKDEEDDRDKRVGEKPERLAAELADRFVTRDVLVSHHGVIAKVTVTRGR
jgi:hypothetical protein